MKATLLGFKSVDFTNKDGEEVKGTTIFFAYPDEGVKGVATDKKYISSELFDSFGISKEQLSEALDTVIDVEFGRKDKIVGLVLF